MKILASLTIPKSRKQFIVFPTIHDLQVKRNSEAETVTVLVLQTIVLFMKYLMMNLS